MWMWAPPIFLAGIEQSITACGVRDAKLPQILSNFTLGLPTKAPGVSSNNFSGGFRGSSLDPASAVQAKNI